MIRTAIFIFIMFFSSLSAFAGSDERCISHDCTSCHSMSDKEAAEILKPLGLTVKTVRHSPLPGMFEVVAEKAGIEGIVYIDYGKKYIMQGRIVDAKKITASSHTSTIRPEKSLSTIDLSTIPMHLSIVMGNPKSTKKIFVFTDPDCPYCRKFHSELIKLEKMINDVAIHIMLLPLPAHSLAFDKSREIVATKSRKLLDDAFAGKEIPSPTNDVGRAAIDAILEFGRKHSIKATPTLVLPDGTVMVGGIDAEALKTILAVE